MGLGASELIRDERDARIEDLEQRLREAERRLEETQALTRVGSWEWDLITDRSSWSKELQRIFGRDVNGSAPSRDELLAAVHPDDRGKIAEILDHISTGPGVFERDYRIVDSEGEILHLRGRGRTVADAAGRPIRGYGTTQDISALKRSDARFEETQALARVGSWEWLIKPDGDWRAAYSREMQRIFGRDPDGPPPTRKELISFVHPADRPAFEELIVKVQMTSGPFEHSYRIVNAEGAIRHMQARGYVEADANGQPWRLQGTTQDITELKESQAQLERARRMEAVGQLAGGVAHDFNNLLAVILNYAEYTIAAGGDPETVKGLREIERAALTGAELTQQLLLFSRRDSNELGSVDLAGVVAETEAMLRRTIGDHIELTVAAPSGLPKATLGDGQARQILINLVVNARDALPQGGKIAVAVRRAEGAGDLVLVVSDDGTGMPEEVAAQAFDPFFTTKPRGKGTGLGLATVYGIATRAGGRIEIESEPGHGTVVSVYLPMATEPERVEPPPRKPSLLPAEGQSVLVVDNEEVVRTIVSHMIAKHGYRVQTAGSGGEAEAILEGSGTKVDLLLTDVLMPGMTGRDLVYRLRARYPSLRAIYMSGYAGDEASPLGPWDDGVTILQKPFTRGQLLHAIGDALAEA
jgi:signal transduction histidine kinase